MRGNLVEYESKLQKRENEKLRGLLDRVKEKIVSEKKERIDEQVELAMEKYETESEDTRKPLKKLLRSLMSGKE